MATTIVTKNSTTAASVPSAGSLTQGELAVNVTDKRLFTKDSGGTVVEVGTNPSGLSVNGSFTINSSAVSIPNGLNFDSNTFVIDATNNTVGIGTASPATKLNIYGTSTQELRISTNTAGDTRLGFDIQGAYYNWIDNYRASGAMAFATNNTERMRIDSSGNVGIGTSSPTTKLSVVSATNAGISVNDGTVNTIIYNSTGGVASIGTTTNHPVDFYANNSARMRIDSSGNVGIGVSNPSGYSSKLVVLASAGGTTGVFTDNTNYTFSIKSGGSGVSLIGGEAGNSLAFQAGASERMRIDTSGNLLVGTTSVLYSSGQQGLSVKTNGGYALVTQPASNNYNSLSILNASGTLVGSVYASSTATAYNTSSDYRLKDNQAPLTGSGAFIDALQPKTWTWKADGSIGTGFIAHEVQAVSPNSVVGEKDAVEKDGKPQYQAMEYGSAEFIANIIAELQDLRKRVAVLESK